MTKIKICGMRRAEDIAYVNEFLPDYAGFILTHGFRRTVSFEEFVSLSKKLDSRIKAVGVFVNEDIQNILKYAPRLDVIQFHGNEDEKYILALKEKTNCEIWKAVRAKEVGDIEIADKLSANKLLIDSYCENAVGGTGKRVNLQIVKDAKITKPFFMAGGINAENANEIINEVKPFGVDFSSSVETDGFKDKKKIKEIIIRIRGN